MLTISDDTLYIYTHVDDSECLTDNSAVFKICNDYLALAKMF